MQCIKRLSLFVIIYFVFSFSNVYAEELPERFDLREYIDIEIRNQEDTNTCWAFSATSLLSMHLAYLHDEIYTFSPRHLEYTMSEDAFTDSENKYAYENKTLDIGGNEEVVKQYYLQGTGPILEKHMPFENNSEPISIEELPLDLTCKQVTNVAHIFPMYKEWVEGELVYSDYTGKKIEQEAVTEYQNSVKTAIKKYGGIEAIIAFDSVGFNYTSGSFNTKDYGDYWHSVLLIGWDDGYSKDNFKESVRPLTDGAYVALNSWGEALGDHGYMYISYEDISIDSITKTYIKEIQDIDYDNAYYKDLSVAKENGEILTEISVAMDSAITGYTYVSLKVDGNYVLKYGVFDDSIENYVLEAPVTLTKDSQVEFEVMVDEQYKQYFHPYYYTVTNETEDVEKDEVEVNER